MHGSYFSNSLRALHLGVLGLFCALSCISASATENERIQQPVLAAVDIESIEFKDILDHIESEPNEIAFKTQDDASHYGDSLGTLWLPLQGACERRFDARLVFVGLNLPPPRS